MEAIRNNPRALAAGRRAKREARAIRQKITRLERLAATLRQTPGCRWAAAYAADYAEALRRGYIPEGGATC